MPPDGAAGPADRSIRVFVSSTFRDMQAEREELVKRVFPQVRRRCESRGVTWGEVDLRWGVTDQQKAEGAVLPICLAEIERTRPYFIGLLGQRYGWIPDEIPALLAEREGWLNRYSGRSVTELEILHGVLNDPDSVGHAYFYLRDPAWVDALPAEERAPFLEEDPRGQRQLADLRARIRSSGYPTQDYLGARDLGDRVLADLTALVDRLFPESTPPDPLDRQAAEHAAFAVSRTTGFVPRPDLRARLDSHAAGDGAPLLITSEAGGGASALVADWAGRWAADHPDDVLVQHFCSAGGPAASWRDLVLRVVGELSRRLPMEGPPPVPPDDAGAMRSLLARALADAATTGRRVILVIDGVHRLEDIDGAPDMLWLPASPPPGTRVVVTADRGRALDTALHRQWSLMEIPPLTPAERRMIVSSVLALHAKALDEVHVTRLAGDDGTGNPLFLRIVLDELRQHGDHLTLSPALDRLLAAQGLDELVGLVLERHEADYERDRPSLVRDALTAVAAARRGLAEAELLDLLGTAEGRLPHAVWSPLALASEQLIDSRAGRLHLANEAVLEAVRRRYLPEPALSRSVHARLAEYFAARPLGARVVDELPWQQLWSGDVAGLVRTLAGEEFIELAYVWALPDLRRLWARAEESGASMAEAYAPVVADPAGHDPQGQVGPTGRSQAVWGIARLLADRGHGEQALRLQHYLLEQARAAPAAQGEGPDGDGRLRAALVNLGAGLWLQGRAAEAITPLDEAVARCRAARDHSMLQAALGDLAMCRRDTGDLSAAAALFEEEGRLCRESGDASALQAHLGNRADLLRRLGQHDAALTLLQEQESLCRDLADRAGIARSLAGQAAILGDRGDIRAALALSLQHGESARADGDLRGEAESLVTQCTLLVGAGDIPAALARADEAEGISRRLGDGTLLSRALLAKALASTGTGDWAGVEAIAREADLTARSADAPGPVATALGLIGTARREQGDLAGCRSTHEEELRVATATRDPQAIASAQANLGTCALAANDLAGALAWYAAAEPAFRQLGSTSSLLPLLANRAQIHDVQQSIPQATRDYREAAACAATLGSDDATRRWGERGLALAYQAGDVEQAEALWRLLADAYEGLADDAALQRALGERALLLLNLAQPRAGAGDPSTVDQAVLATAAGLLDRQEALCRQLGDRTGLAACVGNRAIVLRYQGDLSGALACLDEQARLAQESGNAQGLLIATANRGEVLGLLGRADEALAALGWARETAARYGPALAPMVQQLDAMIAALRA